MRLENNYFAGVKVVKSDSAAFTAIEIQIILVFNGLSTITIRLSSVNKKYPSLVPDFH